MKVLQINSDANAGSAGRIAEDIGNLLINSGNMSFIAYGRTANRSSSHLIKIGRKDEIFMHVIKTRLLDRHGFGSFSATTRFLDMVDKIRPDLVHLHNIHGYYLNIQELFKWLSREKIAVVWTLHDCWPFTGHCSYFDAVECYRWKDECHACPNLKGYPRSWFTDNSRKNHRQKKNIFNAVENLVVVTPSEWLMGHIKNSFLGSCNLKLIHNGIDISKFRAVSNTRLAASYNLTRKYILGVANRWDKRKGLDDFIKLRNLLNPKVEIVLVGLSKPQAENLPAGITGITRTENVDELAELYSGAEVFVNPTYIDNFPSTNLEAMACGTPVITYRTGGSHESVTSATGTVVDKGNLHDLYMAVNIILKKGKLFYLKSCRKHIETNFNKQNKLGEYLELYAQLLDGKNPQTQS